MVTAIQTIFCIGAIAASFRFIEGEYSRMRRHRQINRALAYALCSSLTAAE